MRYTLRPGTRPVVYTCHCLDCQTWSGSAFAENARVSAQAIMVTGPAATYANVSPGGSVAEHIVCGVCHTRIYNVRTTLPGMVVLRAGTLDASERLDPVAHIWVKRKQPWLRIPDGVPCWNEAPPPDAFEAVLRGT